MQDVVIHKRNFVDPTNVKVHTQNVANLWMRAKRKVRHQFRTSTTLFPSYIHEFIFRNCLKNKEIFFRVNSIHPLHLLRTCV